MFPHEVGLSVRSPAVPVFHVFFLQSPQRNLFLYTVLPCFCCSSSFSLPGTGKSPPFLGWWSVCLLWTRPCHRNQASLYFSSIEKPFLIRTDWISVFPAMTNFGKKTCCVHKSCLSAQEFVLKQDSRHKFPEVVFGYGSPWDTKLIRWDGLSRCTMTPKGKRTEPCMKWRLACVCLLSTRLQPPYLQNQSFPE